MSTDMESASNLAVSSNPYSSYFNDEFFPMGSKNHQKYIKEG